MKKLSILFFLLFPACGSEEIQPSEDISTVADVNLEDVPSCDKIIHAWCDYHIACDNVDDNITECIELMTYLYCPANGEVDNERYAVMCYHDLTTAECDAFEMSWPGTCYEALGFEEGCS